MDNLPGILIGLASIVAIAVVWAVGHQVLSGKLVRVDTEELRKEEQRHIALLEEQNLALRKERDFDRSELTALMKQAIEAIASIHLWLQRYEGIGGMVEATRMQQRRHDHDDSGGHQ